MSSETLWWVLTIAISLLSFHLGHFLGVKRGMEIMKQIFRCKL